MEIVGLSLSSVALSQLNFMASSTFSHVAIATGSLLNRFWSVYQPSVFLPLFQMFPGQEKYVEVIFGSSNKSIWSS